MALFVDGLNEVKSQNVVYEICDDCKSGKATTAPRKLRAQCRCGQIGDLLHAYLVGPITPTSLGAAEYMLTVLDDASAASWVGFLKFNSDCATALKRIIMTHIKNRAQRIVLRMRSDRVEFINDILSALFTEYGITHDFTAPYSPESNGKAARHNRTLVKRARTLLAELEEINGTAHKALWAEAMNTTNYIRNRVLNKGTGEHFGHKTPYEILFGRKPNIANIRIFGTKVHVLRSPQFKGNQFDSNTLRGIHVGYSAGNTYRVFLPDSNGIMISRDVTFAEALITDDSSTDINSFPVQPTAVLEGSFSEETVSEHDQESSHTDLLISDGPGNQDQQITTENVTD